MQDEIVVQTETKRQIVDLTDEVNRKIASHKIADGLCTLFVKHTTAVITIGEVEGGTAEDFLKFIEKIIPTMEFRHTHKENHAPDHMIGSLVGPDLTIPVKGGQLDLGTWQRIMFVELDGPRERSVALTLIT